MIQVTETERVQRLQDKVAPKYDRSMGRWEKVLFGGGRQWVCAQASGDVLEIARQRAADLGREVDFRQGDAQALDFPDESFDTVICTLALCTIPDERKAVAEAHRVLRPGGRFVLIEHVRSPVRIVRAVERAIEPLMVRFEGDHLTREPLDHLEPVGFRIEQLERSKWGIVERVSALKPA